MEHINMDGVGRAEHPARPRASSRKHGIPASREVFNTFDGPRRLVFSAAKNGAHLDIFLDVLGICPSNDILACLYIVCTSISAMLRRDLSPNVAYFELSLSFVLFFHSSWPMTPLFSRTSTNDESMMSSISTSSLKSSVALFCFRRSFLTLRFIPPLDTLSRCGG